MKNKFLPKALASVDSLPCEDVVDLIKCIENASSRKQLISYLKGLSSPTSLSTRPNDLNKSESPQVEQADPSGNDDTIRKAICRILLDKELFPTNGELIRTIERELGIAMPTENRFRESRDNIIKKAWSEFSSQKSAVFRARARKFLEKFGPTQDDHYQTLFDILSRRE